MDRMAEKHSLLDAYCKIRTNLQGTLTICESERISAHPPPIHPNKCTVTESTIGSIVWLEAVGDIAQGTVRIDHQRHHHRPPPYPSHPLQRLPQRVEYRSRCDDNWPVGGPGGLSTLTISRRPRILVATMASPGHPIGTTRRSFGVRSSTTNESFAKIQATNLRSITTI